MRIARVELENYKSFLRPTDLALNRGFSIVVGPNNAGKTALLELISQPSRNNPNISILSKPSRTAQPPAHSRIRFEYELDPPEAVELLPDRFTIPQNRDGDTQREVSAFNRQLTSSVTVGAEYAGGNIVRSWFNHTAATGDHPQGIVVELDRARKKVKHTGQVGTDAISTRLATLLAGRVYGFRAERLNIGESTVGSERALATNASNLPSVLHHLQAENPARFQRLVRLVNRVFPDVKDVTIPLPGNAVIRLWPLSSETERDDLAIPLNDAGTGIGQVLAMLFVVLTSDVSRVIVIDEPQSFLHPGAVRELTAILQTFPLHQYVVSTHSPTVIASVSSASVVLVRKVEHSSTLTLVSATEMADLQSVLMAVGARISDVFGAERVLWVEGATEESCFPVILRDVAQRTYAGTAILGVTDVGGLEGRDARRVVDIYRKLSNGGGPLPKAIGFLLDPERRQADDLARIREAAGGLVTFLRRRMFENYLLNPTAISAVLGAGGEIDPKPTPDQARELIELLRAEWKLTRPDWIDTVDGARLLAGVFSRLSGGRVAYDKVRHGLSLTEWIARNSPQDLVEVADTLTGLLDEQTGH